MLNTDEGARVKLRATLNVAVQFGKVAQDIYILDFQPASISVAQAFAVALSAFNKGLCPY